ncbi:hypothetical protein chiPu_0014213 [Chiloscyllium punctatum]|uniref:Serine/threonine-protein kinase haspin n=1 Tax=Chiloscyllium punctatum TaxID=137246 RepID=A0A401SZB4_CHIPU|nr:hypothetical protein [Chiloscyllium punctatum]
MKAQAGGRSALVRTYGKYRQRTVKASKWLSPDTGRDHLFSSSDSIDNSSHCSSGGSRNPSFKTKKRQQKASLNVSNAKLTAKKKIGKQPKSKSVERKHPYAFRSRGISHDKNQSSSSTEDENQENRMFMQDKENRFVPVTRNGMEEIVKVSPNLKYVTYRRKLRNCKNVSNQDVNTQLQVRKKELLGSLIESSESSISFNKPKKAGRSSCKAKKFRCNSRVSSLSGSAFQKNMDLASIAVKSVKKSTVDLYRHPESQTTKIKNLKSTLISSSSVSTPLGSRNWSRFKATHSIHKRKKVIVTPLRSGCTMSLQSSPESSCLSGTENCNNQSLNKLISMANFSATPLSNRMKGSRSRIMEKWSILQPVFLTDEEKVYCECQQNGPVSFKECIPYTMLEKCEKIGEGIFGEVFQMINNGKCVVFKIIPIEGEKPVNGEPQKKFGEVLPEIIISKQLSQLSEESENCTTGFISLYSVHCVKDSYPLELLKAWDKYNQTKSSENDRPDASFKEQLYIIFEFENGGNDLESMHTKIPSLESARSILQQVTASLAVAEKALNFEHRDLHWGNVLVKKTAIKQIEYKLCGKTFNIDTHGFVTNIIDYTLSRMGTDDIVHFCDLFSEDSFFCGQGDYQFDIYRKMKKENFNNWAEYNPHTNVLWLHYLADKMLSMQYKKRNTKAHRILKETFKEFMQECLEYQCAADVLTSAQLFQNS